MKPLSQREAGFTLIETIAGLAILLILVAMVAVFLGPVVEQGEPSARGTRIFELAQLERFLVRQADGLEIPFWWSNDVFEVGTNRFAIQAPETSGISGGAQPLAHVESGPDSALDFSFGEASFQVQGVENFTSELVTAESGRAAGVKFTLQFAKDESHTVFLPLSSSPLALGSS